VPFVLLLFKNKGHILLGIDNSFPQDEFMQVMLITNVNYRKEIDGV
jgi:hypothetical protein